ncbi:MAG TPA: TIGR02996 domain-containing protein [Gemmata sp.]|nr:TIGR02996 domain-containing protein [Gemmata sp.]
MTDRDHLLAAVLADPADDGARLVLADLLRDGDDPDAQARGRASSGPA